MLFENPAALRSGPKRTLDLAAALFILVMVLPVLCPVVWLLQTIQSPGPLFFRQRRIGLRGSPFWILKFRSLPVSASGPEFRFGAWLRLHGWDELPQCIHILLGQMSLVGPRPLVPSEEARAAAQLRLLRSSVRPGLTGLSQILGLRGSHPGVHSPRLQTDLAYLHSWSLTLDLWILLQSIWILFPLRLVPGTKFAGAPCMHRFQRSCAPSTESFPIRVVAPVLGGDWGKPGGQLHREPFQTG